MDKAQRRGQRLPVASRPGLGAFSWVRDVKSKWRKENPDEEQTGRRETGRKDRVRKKEREFVRGRGELKEGYILDVLHGVKHWQLSILKVKEARFAYGGTTLPLNTIAP